MYIYKYIHIHIIIINIRHMPPVNHQRPPRCRFCLVAGRHHGGVDAGRHVELDGQQDIRDHRLRLAKWDDLICMCIYIYMDGDIGFLVIKYKVIRVYIYIFPVFQNGW